MKRGRAGGSWELSTPNKLNLTGAIAGAQMKNQGKGGTEVGSGPCKGLGTGRTPIISLADLHGMTFECPCRQGTAGI